MLTTFFATLSPMITLFICIAVGFMLKKFSILPDNAGKVMAKLETWVFCPALSFSTMMNFCTVDKIGTNATNVLFFSCWSRNRYDDSNSHCAILRKGG